MKNIRTPKLDICQFNNGSSQQSSGKRPSETITRGSKVSVQQNGYEVSLAVLSVKEDGFLGKIIDLDAPSDKYDGLSIGDTIEFKNENISSIP